MLINHGDESIKANLLGLIGIMIISLNPVKKSLSDTWCEGVLGKDLLGKF